MKNLKKMLAVIITVAMMVTTIIPAFAADTTTPAAKSEAKIAEELGMVKGDGNGVTPEYLAKSTQRYQAAVMFLRLMGEETKAQAFDGKENFADAKLLAASMQKYLGYLKANPTFGWNGIGGNKFDPVKVTSAQNYYKVMLEALGYKQGTDFEYADVIKFAESKGLTKVANVASFTNNDLAIATVEALHKEIKAGGKTLCKDLVDRGIITEAAVKAADASLLVPEAKPVTAAVYGVTATNGQLTVVMTEDVGATPANADFTVTSAINGATATAVTGTVYGYTYATKTAVINVPTVAETSTEQSVVYSVKYKDTAAVNAPALVVGASFGIKEVIEPNLKTVKVNLNKDYDSAKDTFTVYKTADTAATVAVTAKAVTGNTKQVLLVATETFSADTDYTVKMTRDSKDYTKAFKVAADVAVPQVASVKAIGNKVIRVTFSEPVDNAAAKNGTDYNYKIGDKVLGNAAEYAVTSTSVSDDLTSVDLTLTNALDAGEYTLTVVRDNTTDTIDYAGYYVPAMSSKFTVAVSTIAAQVKDVTVNSRSEVTVDFTDSIAAPAATVVYWNTDGEESNTSKVANAATKVTDSSYKFSFTTNVIPTGKVYFFVKGVADAFANNVPTKKIEKTVAADSIATTTITVENETTVKVKFSKDMQNGTATNSATAGDVANKTHYTVKKADGTVATISTAAYVAGDKTTTLTLSEKMSGNCTISISGVKDVVGQEAQAVSAQTIVFTDVTAPTVSSVSVLSGSNKIYVVFSEAMATSGTYSALNVANYKWKNAASPAVASYSDLPSGTTIAASTVDSKAVVITLPSDTTTADTTTKLQFGYISGSTIKAVADLAGNVLAIATEGTAAAIANGATTIKTNVVVGTAGTGELKITSGNTLRVKVLGTKLSSVSSADFQYTLDGKFTDNEGAAYAPTSAKLVDVDGTQYIELTTSTDAFTCITDLTKVKVQTVGAPSTSTVTSVGTKIEASAVTPAASTTSFTTTIKSVAIYDNQTVIVKINGNISKADEGKFAESVKLYQGTTLIPATSTIVGSSDKSNVIKLATAANAVDVTGTVTVKTLPVAFITAKDVNGQYIVENQTGVTGSAGFMAGSASITTGTAGADVADNNKITINFSMVPKEVTTATVAADGAGKSKVTIANVGTITGFDSTAADLTGASATVEISGKTIVVTLQAADTTANFQFGDASAMKFTPNTALVNTASVAVDGDVAPIF